MQCIQKVAGNVSEPMMLIFVYPSSMPPLIGSDEDHQRASTYRTKKTWFLFSGFSDLRHPWFHYVLRGAGVPGAAICVFCFGEKFLATWDLDFCILLPRLFRMFMGKSDPLRKLWAIYTICWMFPQASQPSRSKHFGGKQTTQSWTGYNKKQLSMDHLYLLNV